MTGIQHPLDAFSSFCFPWPYLATVRIMESLPDGGLLHSVWDCCISPPALWGNDGYYPVCFSALSLSLSALTWLRIANSNRFEWLVLPFLPRKAAAAIKRDLASARAVISAHSKHRHPQQQQQQHQQEQHQQQQPQHQQVALCRQRAPAQPSRGEEEALCVVCGSPLAAAGEGGCAAVAQSLLFLRTARNRAIGGLHAALVTLLAVCCVCFDGRLPADKARGTSLLFTFLEALTGGYFLWDVYTIVKEWGPGSAQWLLHATISFSSVCSPFLFPSTTPMSYYAASLLLFESSTPFFCLRYFLLKGGAGEEKAGRLVHALFVLLFFSVRLVFGCLFLFPHLWVALQTDPVLSQIARPRRFLYFLWMPLFALLQFAWFLLLLLPRRKARGEKA
ncbi:hypothetical protein Efla_004533 [Eimeria flavescens]